jgi:hypothetical protein
MYSPRGVRCSIYIGRNRTKLWQTLCCLPSPTRRRVTTTLVRHHHHRPHEPPLLGRTSKATREPWKEGTVVRPTSASATLSFKWPTFASSALCNKQHISLVLYNITRRELLTTSPHATSTCPTSRESKQADRYRQHVWLLRRSTPTGRIPTGRLWRSSSYVVHA